MALLQEQRGPQVCLLEFALFLPVSRVHVLESLSHAVRQPPPAAAPPSEVRPGRAVWRLFSSSCHFSHPSQDAVRAPIPATGPVILADDPPVRMGLRRPPRVFGDPSGSEKAAMLERLFRPPVDIMFTGDFDSAIRGTLQDSCAPLAIVSPACTGQLPSAPTAFFSATFRTIRIFRACGSTATRGPMHR